MDNYFTSPEVSNSDLTWLEKYLSGQSTEFPEGAARTGHLADCLITEPGRWNSYHRSIEGMDYVFSPEEVLHGRRMARAFFENEIAATLHRSAVGQKVIRRKMVFNYAGFEFSLDVRCKYDLYSDLLKWGGDLKTTACTTFTQFMEAVKHFDYDRSRAWYMDISGADKDLIIGVSKVNHKVFIVPVVRGGEIYNQGREKYQELAFRWWSLFG